VYGFVKQSGGNATIYSEPGRGTTVNLCLPNAAAGETVLVVEDNHEVRKLALRRLTLPGYRVVEADNGPAALALLDAGAEVDLIFSDVVPGGMTGYKLPPRKDPADLGLRRRIGPGNHGTRPPGPPQALQAGRSCPGVTGSPPGLTARLTLRRLRNCAFLLLSSHRHPGKHADPVGEPMSKHYDVTVA